MTSLKDNPKTAAAAMYQSYITLVSKVPYRHFLYKWDFNSILCAAFPLKYLLFTQSQLTLKIIENLKLIVFY